MALDHASGYIYITLIDGTVLQVDALWASDGIISESSSATYPSKPYDLPNPTNKQQKPVSLTNNHILPPYNSYITVLIPRRKSSSRISSIAVAPLLYRNINSLPWKQE